MNSNFLSSRVCRSALASVAVCAAMLAGSPVALGDTTHIETNFGPGTWTAMPAFLGGVTSPGQVGSCATSRIEVNGNGMLEQALTIDIPSGFNGLFAPVMLNAFVHNPAVDGPIGTVSASVKTFANQAAGGQYFGGMRVFLWQGGRLFTLSNLAPEDTFFGFVFNEPDLVRMTSGRVANDFVEYTMPGIDFNSHPDFSVNGAPITFGFGYSFTSTGIVGDGPQAIPMRFDTAIVRTYTPVPACLGDLNNDGLRNVQDLTIFLGSFGTVVPNGTVGDLNNDGVVNTLDLTTFLGLFGVPCV